MRVLLSGSTGFIGRALGDALAKDGVEVVPVVRGIPRPGEVGIDIARRQLDTSALTGDGLREVDVVFNLAGEPLTPRRWGPAKLERIRSSRILTTDLLARAVATADLERPPAFVSMSAVGYYGNRAEEILTEEAAAGTGFLAETCRSWEAATAPARDSGARVVTCRTGVVLGRGGALAAERRIFKAGLGGRLGSGKQWMSWISLTDTVRALRFLASEASLTGPVNCCAATPVRNVEFTAALGRLLHRPTLLGVPTVALRLAVGSRVTSEFLLSSQRCQPRKLLEADFSYSHPELTACLVDALSDTAPPT